MIAFVCTPQLAYPCRCATALCLCVCVCVCVFFLTQTALQAALLGNSLDAQMPSGHGFFAEYPLLDDQDDDEHTIARV